MKKFPTLLIITVMAITVYGQVDQTGELYKKTSIHLGYDILHDAPIHNSYNPYDFEILKTHAVNPDDISDSAVNEVNDLGYMPLVNTHRINLYVMHHFIPDKSNSKCQLALKAGITYEMGKTISFFHTDTTVVDSAGDSYCTESHYRHTEYSHEIGCQIALHFEYFIHKRFSTFMGVGVGYSRSTIARIKEHHYKTLEINGDYESTTILYTKNIQAKPRDNEHLSLSLGMNYHLGNRFIITLEGKAGYSIYRIDNISLQHNRMFAGLGTSVGYKF